MVRWAFILNSVCACGLPSLSIQCLFIISCCYTRKLFSFQELKGCTATCGDVGHLVAIAKDVNCCCRITAADDGCSVCISKPVPDRTGSSSSSPAPSKPLSESRHLTPDRVKELKQNEDIVQLLYIAEQYLGKTLTPTETRKILFFYDELHMSVDLIDYLIEYCVGRDHRSIRYIETVAMAWKEEGITTVEMAKDSTSRYSKEYFTVLKAMGITNRNPADTEIALINTWTKEYGFTMDLIQEACSRTVLQTGQPSFPYADKILQSWSKKKIRTLEDVRLQDAQHQKRKLEKAAKTPAPLPKATNRFNNFHQRDYDFAEYEKKLLNNSTN